MLKKTVSGLALVFSLLPLSAYSNELSSMSIDQAARIIQDYKQLRSTCAVTEAERKKACFAELGQKNRAYRDAKQRLALAAQGSEVRTAHLY